MTPMIDVVFLLMIFFLAVASLSEARLIRLDLPQFRSEVPEALEREPDAVVINVPRGSDAFVIAGARVPQGIEQASAAVGAQLDRVLSTDGAGVVWIRADRDTDAAAVLRATKAAERALASRGGGVVRFTSVEGTR